MELNTIYNEDCLEGMKKLPDESVDLILTDPPYGIAFVPQRVNSQQKHGAAPIANDELSSEDWVEFFYPICKEMFRVLKKDTVAFLFSGTTTCHYYYYYCLLNAGFVLKANVAWVKNNFGIGYHFRRQYECILVCFKGIPPTPKTAMSDVIIEKKVNGADLLHTCQKPVQLLRRLLRQYGGGGAVVLDPFMGSGSTAVACKQLGMNYIGYEIEQKYIDIANTRLQQATLLEVAQNGNIKQENRWFGGGGKGV